MYKIILSIIAVFSVLASPKNFSVPKIIKHKNLTPYQLNKVIEYGMRERYDSLLFHTEGNTLYLLRRVNTSKEPVIFKPKINKVPFPKFTFFRNPNLTGDPVIITKKDGLYYGDRNILEIERAKDNKNSHLELEYDYFSYDVYSTNARINNLLNVPFYFNGGDQYISISKELTKSFQVKITLEGKDQFLYFDKKSLSSFFKVPSKDEYLNTLLAPLKLREISKEYYNLLLTKNVSGIYKIVQDCFGFYPLKRNAAKNDVKKLLSNSEIYKKFLKLYNIDNWSLNFSSSHIKGETSLDFTSLIVIHREKNDSFVEFFYISSTQNNFTGARCLMFMPFVPKGA